MFRLSNTMKFIVIIYALLLMDMCLTNIDSVASSRYNEVVTFLGAERRHSSITPS